MRRRASVRIHAPLLACSSDTNFTGKIFCKAQGVYTTQSVLCATWTSPLHPHTIPRKLIIPMVRPESSASESLPQSPCKYLLCSTATRLIATRVHRQLRSQARDAWLSVAISEAAWLGPRSMRVGRRACMTDKPVASPSLIQACRVHEGKSEPTAGDHMFPRDFPSQFYEAHHARPDVSIAASIFS